MLSTILGALSCGQVPPPPLEHLGVLVEETEGLPRGTVVEVLERGAEPELVGDILGHKAIRIRAGRLEAWVPGDRVAVRQDDTPTVQVDLDGDGATELLWVGVVEGWEHDEERGFERMHHATTWVLGNHGQAHLLPLGTESSWGSAEQVVDHTVRDLTGDGVAEVLVEVAVYVTEVGYYGRELRVLGWLAGDLRELLRLSVHDPALNGLLPRRIGRVDVREGGIERHSVRVFHGAPCHGEGLCLLAERTVWRWRPEAAAFVASPWDHSLNATDPSGGNWKVLRVDEIGRRWFALPGYVAEPRWVPMDALEVEHRWLAPALTEDAEAVKSVDWLTW